MAECVAKGCERERAARWVFCEEHLAESRAGVRIERKALSERAEREGRI